MKKRIPWIIAAFLAVCLIVSIAVPSGLGEILHPSGNPWVHSFSDVHDYRAATFIVAASDSEHKYEADYFCDGTNDHVQIQAALDALPASGGEVHLLDGTYNCADEVVLNSYQTLSGCGRNTLLTTSSAHDMIEAVGGDGSEKVGIIVKGLALDGDSGASYDGINFDYVDQSKVLRLWITGCDDGIDLHYSDFNQVTGNYIWDNTKHGIWLDNSDHNAVTENICRHHPATKNEIRLTSAEYNVVANNECYDNQYTAIELQSGSDYCTVVGNKVSGSTDTGIDIASYFCTITANVCIENGEHGIYVSAPYWVIIADNVCFKNGENGIQLYNAIDFVVSGNVCTANSQDADVTYSNICVDTCSDGLVHDNICRIGWEANTPSYGIELDNSNRIDVFNNDLYTSGTTGAYLETGCTDTALPEIYIPFPEPDGNIGTHPALVLTDGSDITGRFEVLIPMDFTELVTAEVIIVPGGTGNLRRSVSTNWGKICSGENYNTSTDSIAAGEVVVTISDLACIDIADAFTGIAAGDSVGVEFTREGSHANDTVNADCYLIGFRLQYV